MFRTIFCLTLLSGLFATSPIDAQTALRTIAHTVPAAIANTPCGDSKQLAACLNTLIETKAAGSALTVTIKPGTYTLDDTVLIFQRDDVTIQGTVSWLGTNQTTLKLADALADTQKNRVLQYFHFNVISAGRIALRSMNLDGNDRVLTAQRGIAVCPLSGQHVAGFEFRNLTERNYSSFFTLIGNAYSGHLDTTILKQTPVTAGETRLKTWLAAQPAASRYCSGTVSNVQFEGNTLYMKNVGFYVVPFAAKATGAIKTADPAAPTGPGTDWLEITKKIAERQTGFIVRKNKFIVDLPAGTPQTVQEQAPHSAIKAHYCSGMNIDGNTFDAGPLPYTFGSGAAINLAAGMLDTVVQRNTIKFPAGHRYPQNGIFIHAGFARHSVYGIGDLNLFATDLRTSVVSNILNNTRIRIWDACVNEPNQPKTGAFCRDLSATTGGVKADGILVRGNWLFNAAGQFQFDGDRAAIWRACTEEAARIATMNSQSPDYVECRAQIDLSH